MIQILGIRSYIDSKTKKEKQSDWFFENNWRAPTIPDLLNNMDLHLEDIPKDERFNIFFTHANCTEKKREFKEQWVIPFDFDGIDIARWKEYVEVFKYLIKVDPTVIFSGHGLHLMVHLKQPFTSEGYFAEKRPYYNAICEKLTAAFKAQGVPGHADKGMWKPKSFFRLPDCENQKPNQLAVMARLLQLKIDPVTFDWGELSGVPSVKADDQVNVKHYPAIDTPAVLAGCEFLKYAKVAPAKLKEDQWYAMLGIVGRLKDGAGLAQEYSKGHPGYSSEETEAKLEHALGTTGPNKCTKMDQLWDGCKKCKYWGKVENPINIRSKEFIKTEATGFHNQVLNKDGRWVAGKPCYKDLRQYFENETKYRVLGSSRICYAWTGKCYKEYEDVTLEGFAQDHFDPYAHTGMTDEFKKLVCRTRTRELSWFSGSTHKKINLQNGIYDLSERRLIEHNPEIGFRYVLPYDYDANAKAPLFEKFLQDITCGDQGLQKILMEFAGYAFSGDKCWARKVLILAGGGFNGKSTFLDILRDLAGPDNFTSWTLPALQNEQKCQVMDGKLFNLSDETPGDSWEETEYFKNLSAGGPMSCRSLYKKVYQTENRTKFISSLNDIPRTKDASKGFFTRLLIIPFNADFEANEILGLREKIALERPGIFNLMLEGYTRLIKQGKFTVAEASSAELEAFRLETDHAARWIGDYVRVAPLTSGNGNGTAHLIEEENKKRPFTKNSAMYEGYRDDMIRRGEKPVSADAFGKKLSRVIPDYKSRFYIRKLNGKTARGLWDVTFESERDY